MKTSHAIAVIVGVAIIGVAIFAWSQNKTEVVNTPPLSSEQTSSIAGCYAAVTGKDIYTLRIESQEGENFSGTLAFKNFQKDSSSGTFVGTYRNGILLGDYAFRSEGMDSVMQVAFKRVGDNFIRGYGEVSMTGNRFADVNKLTYDASSSLSVFKKTNCSS